MKLKDQNIKQRHFFIRSYARLEQLKKALIRIKKEDNINSQLSVIGKFSNEKLDKNENELKDYWRTELETTAEFGFFKTPELGSVFIIGSLTPLFLHEVDGKVLGAMSTGFYGILRGLGAYKFQAETYLKALKNGNYLLILRAFDDELIVLEELLQS